MQSVEKEGEKKGKLLLLENTVVAQWGSVLMQNVTYHQGETHESDPSLGGCHGFPRQLPLTCSVPNYRITRRLVSRML